MQAHRFSRAALSMAIALSLPTTLSAENLGGGKVASNGRVPQLLLDSWIPGSATKFRFEGLPSTSRFQIVCLGSNTSRVSAGTAGTLVVDLLSPFLTFLPAPASGISIPSLPKSLEGAALTMQGIYFEPQGGLGLTDGTRVDLFTPLVMVGNSRQTSNSISVIDIESKTVKQRLTNSENGYIEFSPDRTRAYVCEPGLRRDRVVVYDLTKNPITVLTTVGVSGGIRYGGSMPRDGKRLYVPVHDGIAILDTDPTSSTYHTEIRKLNTRITGSPTSIFTGPLHTAVTPDGKKLYVAHGESQAVWPSKGVVSVFDLTQMNPSETQIQVTNGGVFGLSATFSFATRPYIEMSHDGREVYVLEFGVNASAQFAKGYVNGSVINVINTVLDREMRVIDTGGFNQEQIGIDRLDRGLWLAQSNRVGGGELVRIDVARNSSTRYAVQKFAVNPSQTYTAGQGPSGVDVTPDGSRVYVSVVERTGVTTPEVLCFDARTRSFDTKKIRVESLCHTLSVQKR